MRQHQPNVEGLRYKLTRANYDCKKKRSQLDERGRRVSDVHYVAKEIRRGSLDRLSGKDIVRLELNSSLNFRRS